MRGFVMIKRLVFGVAHDIGDPLAERRDERVVYFLRTQGDKKRTVVP